MASECRSLAQVAGRGIGLRSGRAYRQVSTRRHRPGQARPPPVAVAGVIAPDGHVSYAGEHLEKARLPPGDLNLPFFATDTDKARCVRDATADAVTKINQPALSAVYSANNKTSAPSGLVSQSR